MGVICINLNNHEGISKSDIGLRFCDEIFVYIVRSTKKNQNFTKKSTKFFLWPFDVQVKGENNE